MKNKIKYYFQKLINFTFKIIVFIVCVDETIGYPQQLIKSISNGFICTKPKGDFYLLRNPKDCIYEIWFSEKPINFILTLTINGFIMIALIWALFYFSPFDNKNNKS